MILKGLVSWNLISYEVFFSLNIEMVLWGDINLNAKFYVENILNFSVEHCEGHRFYHFIGFITSWVLSLHQFYHFIGFITSVISVLSFHRFYNFNFGFEPQWISYNLLS